MIDKYGERRQIAELEALQTSYIYEDIDQIKITVLCNKSSYTSDNIG